VTVPHTLENGALAISALWLETEIKQDAVVAGLKYKGQVLQIDGVLKDKSLEGDKLHLTFVGDLKKEGLKGFHCTVSEPASVRAGGVLKFGQPVTVAGTVERIPDTSYFTSGAFKDCVVLTGHPDPAVAQAQIAKLAGVDTAATAAPPGGAPAQRVGTAYFVSADGYLLTGYEVVKGCRSILSRETARRPLVVIKMDSVNDMVLLKLTGEAPAVARFRSGAGVKLGDTVRLAGRPAPESAEAPAVLDLTTGTVSALTGNDDTRMIRITAPARPGAGGAPVLDEHGAVVAQIVLTGDQNEATAGAAKGADVPANGQTAIVAELLRRFLEVNGVRFETAATDAQTAPLDDLARGFTLPFVCTLAPAKEG
jgi:S1-C subfamily serine protease